MKQPSLIEHSQEEYTSIIEEINYKSELSKIVNIVSAMIVLVSIVVIFKMNTKMKVQENRINDLEKANDSLRSMQGVDLIQHTSH